MRLQYKINFLSLGILVAVALAISLAGVLTIGRLASDLNQKLMVSEIRHITGTIRSAHDVLEQSGVGSVPAYVQRAQDDLIAGFSNYSLGKTGRLAIISIPDNRVVVHDVLSSPAAFDLACINDLARVPRGSIECSYRGENRFFFFETFAPWNWLILLSVTTEEMYQERDVFLRHVAVILCVSLVLGAVVYFWFARGIVSPILELAKSAVEISQGQWDRELPEPKSGDEVGELTRVFRTMRENLSDANHALKASEEKYRSLVESTSDWIWEVDEKACYTYASPKVKSILGYEPEEVVGRTPFELMPEEEALKVGREFEEIAQAKRPFKNLVNINIHKDGHPVYLETSGDPILDHKGNLLGYRGVDRDISERKAAEKDRAALEEQLRQSQKMEAVGSLAGGIAHDFNNLLHAISGYLQLLLLKKPEDDPDCKYLSEIQKATARATDIAQRLLTFSRKIEVKSKLVNLNEVVGGTLKMLEHTLPKMISIKTDLAPDLLEIKADPTQLDQVLMNLASNASDAMGEEGELQIRTENIVLDSTYRSRHLEVEPGEYVVLTFTDSGAGMDRETLEHIFDPFFTTKEVGKGTGLGLSIIYGIIKGHKGHINCYSEAGVGTTFRIYLPAIRSEGQEQAAKEMATPQQIEQGTGTILVVDDEKMIREIAKEVLEAHGYTVFEAASGEDAIAMYEKHQEDIHLVLLDLGMPGMGGEKCLAELKKIDPQVRVIVASGYAAHKIAQKPDAFGAAGFVTKPYPLQEMLSVVKRVLTVG